MSCCWLGRGRTARGGSRGGTYPMNMKRKQAVVISAPRLEGDSIPSIATTAEGNRTRNSSSEGCVLQQLEDRGLSHLQPTAA